MIGGLDRPSAGTLTVNGLDLFKLSQKELVTYKRDVVGFVWQNNARNLIPYLTAWENVAMPMMMGKPGIPKSSRGRRDRARQLLELVGMEKRQNSRLSELSGGEQQRIAIAIALANDPVLLLADEPTGSVDVRTSDYILDVFRRLNEELGITVVIVTHDRHLAKKVNRVVAIRDGKTSSEFITRSLKERMASIGDLSDADAAPAEETVQEEFAVMDRAHRLQIPEAMLKEIGAEGNKVKLEVEDGHIVIKPQ